MKTAIAKKVFMFSTDAPSDEALIEFANAHALQTDGRYENGLDSLDLGDTLGYFIYLMELREDEESDIILVAPQGFTVTISYDWELFRWNTNERPTTLMHLIEDIGVNEVKRRIRDEFGEN